MTMTISDIAHMRLDNQHLLQPDFATPADVVRWFGAVQAQDLASALYAIGLRMPEATEPIVEKAVTDRTIVRSWPMRGTIHFIPPEDARWMLKLLAHRQTVRNAGMYRKAGLTEAIFAQAGDALSRALQGGKQLTRKELYAALAEAGIQTGGDLRGLFLLGYWAQEGLICFGPRQGKQQTFVLLDDWLPPGRLMAGDEALALLARRYFVSHGPATIHDFAWWAGLTIAESRHGVHLVAADLSQELVNGRTYWFGPHPPPKPRPHLAAYLLPPYDECTVAYKDRSAFLDPALTKTALNGIGPSVILDGRMIGTWKRVLQRDAVRLTLSLFAPLNPTQHGAVVTTAEHYGRFLGLPVLLDPPTTAERASAHIPSATREKTS